MKKLMTLMLGLSLALGSVAVTFAQDPHKDMPMPSKKKEPTKKKSKKKDAPKKEGDR
jgi:hypothetical protein